MSFILSGVDKHGEFQSHLTHVTAIRNRTVKRKGTFELVQLRLSAKMNLFMQKLIEAQDTKDHLMCAQIIHWA